MIGDKKLDKGVPIPLYYQLKTILLEELSSGNYPPGSIIPTEDEISELFDISRTTVRQAITDLVREGKLSRTKGKGTFVESPKVDLNVAERLSSVVGLLDADGRAYPLKTIKKEIIDVPPRFDQHDYTFSCKKLIHIVRINYVNDVPVILSHTYVDYERAPFINDYDMEDEILYSLLERSEESKVAHVHRLFEATNAKEEDREYLNVKKSDPILRTFNYGLNSAGILIEYTSSMLVGKAGHMRVDLDF